MEKYKFAKMKEYDLKIVLEIYNYYVRNSTAIWFTRNLNAKQLRDFVFINHPKYKSFLIKNIENEVCGFCLLTRYKKRQAYDRTAEITIYMKPGYTGQGIGTLALGFLEKAAKKAGIKVLIGVISGDNKASIKLFKRKRYMKCAHYKKIGEKFGKVLDVVAYQRILSGTK